MMYVTCAYNKGSSVIAGIKDHFQKHGKTYLVGLAVVGALAIAAYARANVEDTYMVRHGGGRVISIIGEMAASAIEEIDPTPKSIKTLLRFTSSLPSN